MPVREWTRQWGGRLSLVAMAVLAAVIVVGVATGTSAPADRADALSARLRCPVCQGLSVAESRSDTALAMQSKIREMVAADQTDQDVLGYFTQRYGTWILLDPSDSGLGFVLWGLPVLALLAGGALIVFRRSPPPSKTADQWRAAVQEEVAERRKESSATPETT